MNYPAVIDKFIQTVMDQGKITFCAVYNSVLQILVGRTSTEKKQDIGNEQAFMVFLFNNGSKGINPEP